MDAAEVQAVWEALRENHDAPYGRTRTVHAEQLVERAGRAGDREVLVVALGELVTAYEYGGERGKMFVPFSRLLRMWDERPSDFDAGSVHRLHWQFKWVTAGMVRHPQIPLATIRQWLSEMDRRYQVGGYGPRAVRLAEFVVARHVGDEQAAWQAYDRWLAAERDEMSDCAACELATQGSWLSECGRDAEALERWRDVLDGSLSCQEEPHYVLSRSLLPLCRLGRFDEARAHHLRGYRMVRGVLNLQDAVGRHVEFCALTGNEARGLEILAEHCTWFDEEASPEDRLDFLAGAGVLLRRLRERGHGFRQVTGPGRRLWTVEELLARVEADAAGLAAAFDARNGTGRFGEDLRTRSARQPLLAALPLGVRTAGGVPPVAAVPPPDPQAPDPGVTTPSAVDLARGTGATDPGMLAGTGAVDSGNLDDLVARARQLTDTGHPHAGSAWDRVVAVAGEGGLDPETAADVACSRGLRLHDDPARARVHFLDAAERYGAAGRPDLAVTCRARAAAALVLAGQGGDGLRELDAAVAAAEAAVAAGDAEPRAVAAAVAVRGYRSVALFRLWLQARGEGTEQRADELARDLTAELDAVVERGTAAGDLRRVAIAHLWRGQFALSTGDHEGGVTGLRRAVELFVEAGQPWAAVEPALALAQFHLAHGAPDAAEEQARAALGHGADLEADTAARARALLAECHAARDHHGEAAAAALDAAHWFDTAGEPAAAAYARVLLARAYRALHRPGEAAAVLEETMPDIVEHHVEFDVARARQTLGFCLSDLGEHRAAAEQFLLAADVAASWEDERPHAMLASDAAQALAEAGLTGEAVRAYERAADLWRRLGATGPLVRSLRAWAWQAAREDPASALGLMEQARGVLSTVDPDAGADGDLDPGFETAETWDQTARLLAQAASAQTGAQRAEWAGQAYECALRAVAGFEACGNERFGDLLAAHILAAQVEADLLGRPEPAVRRLHDAIALCERHGGPDAEQRVAYCRSVLAEIEHPQ